MRTQDKIEADINDSIEELVEAVIEETKKDFLENLELVLDWHEVDWHEVDETVPVRVPKRKEDGKTAIWITDEDGAIIWKVFLEKLVSDAMKDFKKNYKAFDECDVITVTEAIADELLKYSGQFRAFSTDLAKQSKES